MVERIAPWLGEVLKKGESSSFITKEIVRENPTSSQIQVQLFLNGRSPRTNKPDIEITPQGECRADIQLDLSSIGRIKDARRYQKIIKKFNNHESCKKARDLLKT